MSNDEVTQENAGIGRFTGMTTIRPKAIPETATADTAAEVVAGVCPETVAA
ncbi:MAG: hypothetical protein NT138_08500 [Planctomycetales bacterium]|nr:hypothetical protein [Planctomycetales bacterium]